MSPCLLPETISNQPPLDRFPGPARLSRMDFVVVNSGRRLCNPSILTSSRSSALTDSVFPPLRITVFLKIPGRCLQILVLLSQLSGFVLWFDQLGAADADDSTIKASYLAPTSITDAPLLSAARRDICPQTLQTAKARACAVRRHCSRRAHDGEADAP